MLRANEDQNVTGVQGKHYIQNWGLENIFIHWVTIVHPTIVNLKSLKPIPQIF